MSLHQPHFDPIDHPALIVGFSEVEVIAFVLVGHVVDVRFQAGIIVIDEDEFLPVLETTYYYEKWRSYAVEVVESVAEKVSQEVFTVLCSFSLKVSEMYIEHIKSQINELSAEKEKVSSQLSEGELLLQIDRDWHTSFCDKLYEIERA